MCVKTNKLSLGRMATPNGTLDSRGNQCRRLHSPSNLTAPRWVRRPQPDVAGTGDRGRHCNSARPLEKRRPLENGDLSKTDKARVFHKQGGRVEHRTELIVHVADRVSRCLSSQ